MSKLEFLDFSDNLYFFEVQWALYTPSDIKRSTPHFAHSVYILVYVSYCHVIMTIDEVWIGNWIYCTRNYK
jgi:hypothetical protein